MRELTKIEKTQLRVALAVLHHLRRFRLVKIEEDELDLDKVLETVSDLLDLFEERLPGMRRAGAKGSPNGGSTADELLRRSKPNFSFRENKEGTMSLS